jgi:HlyD family secretion protein
VKKLIILLLLVGGFLAGAVWWFNRRQNGDGNGAQYTTAPVEYGRIVETVSATGIIQPKQVYTVGSETVGRVIEILVDINQEVEEGAILARIDDQAARKQRDQAVTAIEAAQIGVRQATAQRDTAKKVLEREQTRPPELRRDIEVQVLTNQLTGAEAALEAARNKVTQAKEGLALAEIALNKAIVRAPILRSPEDTSSVGALVEIAPSAKKRKFLVLDRRISLGQMIGPILQGNLFTLAGDFDTVQIEAQVAEGDISKVAKGLKADFTVASYSDIDLQFQGKVTDVRLLPVNDRGAVFYKVILEAKNERDPETGRWQLTPGLTTTIEIVRREHDNTWKMPGMALSFQPEEAKLSAGAREKLKKWQTVKDRDDWKPVWVVGEDKKPWPILVRIGGVNRQSEKGIRDMAKSLTEVLEWDPDLAVKPDPAKPESYPQVIIAAPQSKGGFSLKF